MNPTRRKCARIILVPVITALLCGCAHLQGGKKAAAPSLQPEYAERIAERFDDASNKVANAAAAMWNGRLSPAIPPRADVLASLEASMRWLREQQAPDGSWSSHAKVRTTSLSLLAFLWRHYLAGSSTDRHATLRARDWLLANQAPDGSWGRIRSVEGPIDHALATRALAETSIMTDAPYLREPLGRAVDIIIANQQAGGAWAAGYGQSQYRNTLVSVCQLWALHTAWMAGVEHPGLQSALERAAADLLSAQDPATGVFGSAFRGADQWGATGQGILGLQLIGLALTPEVREGLAAFERREMGWVERPLWPMLELYFNHTAMYLQGGRVWAEWEPGVADELIKGQKDDGHWEPPGGEAGLGPAYATALCSLILQTPCGAPVILDPPRKVVAPPAWEIAGEGGTAFLLCTLPAAERDFYFIRPAIMDALTEAETIYVPFNQRRLIRVLEGHAVYCDETSFNKASADTLKAVARLLELPPTGWRELRGIKPWALAAAVAGSVFEKQGVETDRLEELLVYEVPGTPRKDLLEHQIVTQAVTVLSEEEQAALLAGMVSFVEQLPAYRERLIDAWARGDVRRLEQLLDEPFTTHPDLSLLRERVVTPLSEDLAEALDRVLQEPGHYFVVLGAWHALGDKGVVELLRQRGYAIRRVGPTESDKD